MYRFHRFYLFLLLDYIGYAFGHGLDEILELISDLIQLSVVHAEAMHLKHIMFRFFDRLAFRSFLQRTFAYTLGASCSSVCLVLSNSSCSCLLGLGHIGLTWWTPFRILLSSFFVNHVFDPLQRWIITIENTHFDKLGSHGIDMLLFLVNDLLIEFE